MTGSPPAAPDTDDLGTRLAVTQPAARGAGSVVLGLLRSTRPKQWVKNLLVFAAPASAGALSRPDALLSTLVAFVAFSLAAGGGYLVNDIVGMAEDRGHAAKRNRPIAAGLVAAPLAAVAGAGLMLGAVALAAVAVNWELAALVVAYLVLAIAYSLWFRRTAILDLGAVSAGFVLRAVAGGAAVGVPLSNWFFVVTLFGALFVVVGKRYGEQIALADEPRAARDTLSEYSTRYLEYVRAVSTSAVLLAYALWAFDRTAAGGSNGLPWFELSIGPFILGVLRYGLLLDRGFGEEPEELILADRPLQLAGLAWAIMFGLAVYG
jgi:decaprenyl-phosphate phosphoribosyltransferase